MRKRILLLILLFFTQLAFGQPLPIVPFPQDVNYQTGNYDLNKKLHFIPSNNNFSLKGISLILNDLQQFSNNKKENSSSIIWLDIVSRNPQLQQLCKENKLPLENLGEEGYHLLIRPDSIILASNTDAGLLYGLQSLKQLFQYYQSKGAIPCLQITDFPAFKYRAVMDDISRGPLSNMNFLKAQVRRLSALKINVFTFYIEHVVKTKKHPLFAPNDGITIEEFQKLSAYAKEWNIELIGSFQSLGHFRNVLNAPEYRHLGATDRMLQPATPESLQFLKEVYAEMLPAFSSDFFNINSDEAWDLVRGDLKPLADSLGAGRLFANHVRPLLEFLIAKNKKPMMWGDMLLAYPDAFDDLPKETTILTWEYSGFDDFSKWIDPIKKRGFDFWVCPGIVNSNKLLPDYEEAFINLKNFINEGYEKGAKGVMTTIWDDGGGHLFSRDWYGVAYAAEQSWRPNTEDFSAFDQRFSQTFYQDEQILLPRAIHTLQKLKDLNSTQKLQFAFLEEQLLPDFGEEHRLNVKDLAAISSIALKAQKLIHELSQSSSIENDWQNDLHVWQFFTKHLLAITTTYQTLIELSETYEDARRLQEEKQANYMVKLIENRQNVQGLLKEWKALKDTYVKLWFQENRLYSLQEATTIFDTKIEALIQLETLLGYVENLPFETPLPAPTAIQLSISPNYDNYFTFWLLSEPFPISKKEDFSTDFLTSLNGELNARPTPYDWQKYQSPFSDKIDLKKIVNLTQPAVIYAYCRIESLTDQDVIAKITFDNQLAVVLNGVKLVKQTADSTTILNLKEGKNHLILKILCTPTTDHFSFYLPEVEIRNRKQKYQVME